MQFEQITTQNIFLSMINMNQITNELPNLQTLVDTENKKVQKQKEKEEEKKQKQLSHLYSYIEQEDIYDYQNDDSTGDQNVICEPKKQKKIKLNENMTSSPSITSNQLQEEQQKQKDVEVIQKDIISEDSKEEDENSDYDDFPIPNGQSTLSLKKVYKRQIKSYNGQVLDDEVENQDNEDEKEELSDLKEFSQPKKEYDENEQDNENIQTNKINMDIVEYVNNSNDNQNNGSEEENYYQDNDQDGNYFIPVDDLIDQRNNRYQQSWADQTLNKLEIDDLDEPINEDQDIEGFDVEEVMQDEKRKLYIENLMECLPPYMYCTSLEEKEDFFQKLNKEFKRNLQIESNPLKHSHKKKVKFNFQKVQVVEFDFTKKVKNISKLPVKEGINETKTN